MQILAAVGATAERYKKIKKIYIYMTIMQLLKIKRPYCPRRAIVAAVVLIVIIIVVQLVHKCNNIHINQGNNLSSQLQDTSSIIMVGDFLERQSLSPVTSEDSLLGI